MDSSLGIKLVEHHQQHHNHYNHHLHHHHHQQQQQQQSCVLPNNEDHIQQRKQINTRDLELFFENGLYNSCHATDELMKNIEQSQNEALARKALDLYQRHYSNLERPWDHVTFMYGLGLIYMHFNAYNWAIKSFREAIYVQPSFPRSRDVHTRLGLIFKATGRYKLSEKHFNLAINDTRPDSGTCTKLELRFHLAHLYEIQGKFKQATDAYERLLQEKDLPPKLSANIHRQLGWIYYSTSTKDSSVDFNDQQLASRDRKDHMFNQHQNMLSDPQKMDAALNYLNASFRTDSDSKTSYYLGRCLTNIGRFQDAFASYRSVIDREESTADTWCSIGVLYHRQNQPWDALQAYIRSVQFDKKHSVAWMNLGILYESHNQFQDALKCYQHVLRSSPNGIDRSLQTRIKYIQRHLAEIEASLNNNSKSKINFDKLLGLEDLWNLESKTNSESSTSSNNTGGINAPNTHKMISNLPQLSQTSNTTKTPCPQQEANHQLQINAESRTTPMEINLQRLSNGPIVTNHFEGSTKTPTNNCTNDANISTYVDGKSRPQPDSIHQNSQHTSNHNGLSNDCKLEITTQGNQEFNPQSLDSKDFCLNQALTNGASKDSGISSNSSTYADCALVPSQNTEVGIANYLSAEQVIESCKSSPRPRRIDINLLVDEEKPPCMFPRPPPYPPLPREKLFPSPPSVFLETKKDLASRKLQDFCQSSPISIVRNIATVLKLDLGLFSTKTLVESNPDQQVDIISHLSHQTTNNDEDITNFWSCERQESFSTISRYASYQAASFRESLQEERDNKSKTNLTKESETDSNESGVANTQKKNNGQGSSSSTNELHHNHHSSNSKSSVGPATKKFKKEQSKPKYVRSADKIDLSDEKRWRPQLNELNKLPHFIKCVSASNMLTHIGTAVPGVNTIVMSMHVPGCKMIGNKTPNNFCPISINTGPGDYEWCAVSSQYERILTRLCDRNGFELNEKDWWPKISDLQKYNVPVYRFSQRPGDLVWVNSGTFYWVQATGWANSIQWNVGPLCARQYRLASEKFEVNKLIFRKSDVPMVQMTWNIVMNINIITDDELFRSITDVLRRSLRYCCLIRELVEESKKEIVQSSDAPGPRYARFCSLCDIEIFNITFTRKQDAALHCIECARRSNESLGDYDIKQEYDLSYLTKLYDSFIETKKKLQARQEQIRQQ